MNLREHFIISLILSIAIFPIYGYQSLLVLVSGFFIDIDHYFYSIYKHKNFNMIDSYYYNKRRDIAKHDTLGIFHTVEFWILMLVLFIIFKNDFFYPLLY